MAQTTIQLTTGVFTTTGYNLTGAFIQRVLVLTTGVFSTVGYDVVMDGFAIPETPAESAPSVAPEEDAGPQDVKGRAPSWRKPGSSTGGMAWRTPNVPGGPWRRA